MASSLFACTDWWRTGNSSPPSLVGARLTTGRVPLSHGRTISAQTSQRDVPVAATGTVTAWPDRVLLRVGGIP
ncbi:hypothetical protein BH18ACT9_BH18ACT9_08870 [soil metagenome]